MKGFIEVTVEKMKILININHIATLGDNYVICTYINNKKESNVFECEETYEQIKELIKQAQ